MKNLYLLFLLISSVFVLHGQEFRPYQVKSGHIRYQTIRFILHSESHTDSTGKMIAKSEQIPYVSRIRDYYWDDYGDVSRDMIYKASDMGGKPLPEKKKVLERLWLDGRMYYLQNEKVAFDPDHLRDECFEKKQLFQKEGWFKVLYPEARPMRKEKVAGREGVRYLVDAFSEYVLWKGLVLHDVSYFTNRAGVRKGNEREETAVEVQTGTSFKPGFFNPLWYQKFTPYYLLDADRIAELMDGNPDLLEQAENYGLLIKKGETLLYVTSAKNPGKLSVLNINPQNNNMLSIEYVTYNNDGSVKNESYALKLNKGDYCDLDSGKVSTEPFAGQDFRWIGKPFPILLQGKTLGFYLIKSSINQK